MLVSMAKTAGRFGVLLVGLWAGLATANAQQTAPPAAAAQGEAAPSGAARQDDIKQIKLTDEQVKRFVSAQADLAAIASKMQAAGDTPDPALQAELESIATKHGFGNFAELDDVAANISIVMAGLDSTGVFVDPVEALKKERDDVQKDASIPDADKKQLMDELTEAIGTTPKLEYKENIEIVKAHKAEIEKALQ